jgi:hypothetical protein
MNFVYNLDNRFSFGCMAAVIAEYTCHYCRVDLPTLPTRLAGFPSILADLPNELDAFRGYLPLSEGTCRFPKVLAVLAILG